MEKRFLEECLAKGMSLEAMGEVTGKHPSTIGYWMRKHGLRAVGVKKYARRGAVAREDLEALVGGGATLGEIAEALDRSVSTVRYWLARYKIETTRPSGRGRRTGDGSKTATFDRRRHGRTELILEGRGYYRCKQVPVCRGRQAAQNREEDACH